MISIPIDQFCTDNMAACDEVLNIAAILSHVLSKQFCADAKRGYSNGHIRFLESLSNHMKNNPFK